MVNQNRSAHPPRQGRVITAYKVAYPDPLILKKGDEITVGANDTQWPGFVWCTDKTGKSGWVAERYFERRGDTGLVVEDYEATELSAEAGEVLTLLHQDSGWWWSANQMGKSGWIPAENVEFI